MDTVIETPFEAAQQPAPDAWIERLTPLVPGCPVLATAPRYYAIDVPGAGLREAVARLRAAGIAHLTTIVGEDMRDHFLVSYVLAGEVVVVVRVRIDDREQPSVPSLAPLLAGALVYEREIHDMLGIVPAEHPDLRRQALPEDFPEGLHPLRKDAVLPKPVFVPEGGE